MVLSEGRIAGLLMLGSLVPFVLFAFLGIKGASPATYGLFRPIEDLAAHLPVSAWGLIWQLSNLVFVLAGFAILTSALQGQGETYLPVLGFGLLLISVCLTALEATFYQGVSPWAAQEAARTGATPEIFSVMFKWMNTYVQIAYMIFGLVAYAAFGWSILRSGYLPTWAGWATVIWASIWLVFTAIAQTTLPMGVFLWPWVLGGVMLLVA